MKNLTKIVIMFFAFFMIINVCTNYKVYATRIDNIIQKADAFTGAGSDDAINKEQLAEASKNIFYIFLTIAIAIAVIVGAFIGIKIMIGTIEEKAKMKEMLVPYVVGVAIISMTFFIWSSVVKIGTSVVGEGSYQGTTTMDAMGTVTARTNLYRWPDTESDIILELSVGQEVLISKSTKGFYFVTTHAGEDIMGPKSATGYVKIDMVSLK